VSPRYAQEICTPEFGCGLDNLLNERRRVLSGILNGVDYTVWDPSTDRHIDKLYSSRNLSGKATCKAAVQKEFGLELSADQPLFAVVSRLTDQKGMDLMLAALPELVRLGGQFMLIGTGDKSLEERFAAAASAMPGRVAVRLTYDEALAHRLIAAADLILVPSRFEPCGLTQLYGLRYGTLPLVRKVGGLSDTVADTNHDNIQAQAATGFTFEAATTAALLETIQRAITAFSDKYLWRSIMERGMTRDYSWDESSKKYLSLYRDLLG
jgi:starch synthase